MMPIINYLKTRQRYPFITFVASQISKRCTFNFQSLSDTILQDRKFKSFKTPTLPFQDFPHIKKWFRFFAAFP